MFTAFRRRAVGQSSNRPRARGARSALCDGLGGSAPRGTWRAAALAVVLIGSHGCEDKKGPSPSDNVASAAPSAAPAPVVAAPTSTPSAAAPARRRKDPAACPKSDPVVFDDAVLEAAIRRQTQKPNGPISRADLRRVKTLDLSQAPRDDELDPCIFAHLAGLKSLYLAPGELDDVTALQSTPNVESLRLAATRVTDLRPLTALHNLDRLDIGRTPVRDLAPLADLHKLTELQIDDTDVSALDPLAKLENLEVLLMKRTRVKDVSPLRGLRKLKHLYIEGSTVDDVSALSGLRTLKIHRGP